MIEPIIRENLRILFVGINPVAGSIKEDGYDYFSNNSTFYTILKESGITDKKISSKELLDHNLGIVNFYHDVFGAYEGMAIEYIDRYRGCFLDLLGKYLPNKVAIMSKHVAECIFLEVVNFGHIRSMFYCVPFPTYPLVKTKKLNYYKELL